MKSIACFIALLGVTFARLSVDKIAFAGKSVHYEFDKDLDEPVTVSLIKRAWFRNRVADTVEVADKEGEIAIPHHATGSFFLKATIGEKTVKSGYFTVYKYGVPLRVAAQNNVVSRVSLKDGKIVVGFANENLARVGLYVYSMKTGKRVASKQVDIRNHVAEIAYNGNQRVYVAVYTKGFFGSLIYLAPVVARESSPLVCDRNCANCETCAESRCGACMPGTPKCDACLASACPSCKSCLACVNGGVFPAPEDLIARQNEEQCKDCLELKCKTDCNEEGCTACTKCGGCATKFGITSLAKPVFGACGNNCRQCDKCVARKCDACKDSPNSAACQFCRTEFCSECQLCSSCKASGTCVDCKATKCRAECQLNGADCQECLAATCPACAADVKEQPVLACVNSCSQCDTCKSHGCAECFRKNGGASKDCKDCNLVFCRKSCQMCNSCQSQGTCLDCVETRCKADCRDGNCAACAAAKCSVCKTKELEAIEEVEQEQGEKDNEECSACAAATCSVSCPGMNCAACLEARCDTCTAKSAAFVARTVKPQGCHACAATKCSADCPGLNCDVCMESRCFKCKQEAAAADLADDAEEESQGCSACAATKCSFSCPGENCDACLEARCDSCLGLGDLVEANDELADVPEEEVTLSPKCEKCIVQRCESSCKLGQDCTKCIVQKCNECSAIEIAAIEDEIQDADEPEEPTVTAGAFAAAAPVQDAKKCNACSLAKCKASCTKDSCPACARKKCIDCTPKMTKQQRMVARKQQRRKRRN